MEDERLAGDCAGVEGSLPKDYEAPDVLVSVTARESEALEHVHMLTEEPASGRMVGFARSVERSGLMELTEFFVRPDQQVQGIGRTLLERVFTAGPAGVRSIVATMDVRAQARYYAASAVARSRCLTGTACNPGPLGDLAAEPIVARGRSRPSGPWNKVCSGHERLEHEIGWSEARTKPPLSRAGSPPTLRFSEGCRA